MRLLMVRARYRRRTMLAVLTAVACLTVASYPLLAGHASAATSTLSVSYRTTEAGATAGETEPWLTVHNSSAAAVPLSQVTLRYYFAADNAPGYTFACAWAVLGCANLTGTVVTMPTHTATADHYLQIAFTAGAGSLAAGATTGDLQLRLYRTDWQSVNQADDYSFGAQTSYVAWPKVTAYRNGVLDFGTPPVPDSTTSPTVSPPPTGGTPGNTLFDDFNYSGPSDANLAAHDWTIRTSAGGPGVSGATWSANAFSFPTDPANSANKLMRLTASTAGTGATTTQAEIDTTQRKFFEGTYAARVYFTDTPTTGTGADAVNETFYTITPDEPNYSELDNEYLPNGGWGAPGPTLYTTTWYSADAMDRQTHNVLSSLSGWHTLEMTATGGTVTYYVDGTVYFSTTGKYYPREAMTLDFNEWFIDGELAAGTAPRTWTEQVDWVYYAQNTALTPAQVSGQVNGYRTAHTTFTDTVPAS